jgi:glutaminyl-peptide cyclotransferase
MFSISQTSAAKTSSLQKLPTAKLKNISTASIDLIMEDLDSILLERIPGTNSHKVVEVFIRSKFQGHQWIVETDSFTADTPHGAKEFTNIIVTHNSSLDEPFLLLGAHYDSKYFKDQVFLGAIDSAVPCALLIDIARSLSHKLSPKRKGPGLKIVFFDGEEAFGEWSTTDSLYGSRHLATKWENTYTQPGQNMISKIQLMVLLDLLGAESPALYSMHPETAWLFDHLAGVEGRLANNNLVTKRKATYFRSQRLGSHVDDDHRPFMHLGVPVLHIIPLPFPTVWHTPADNKAALSVNTIDELSRIFRVFVAEYLRVK